MIEIGGWWVLLESELLFVSSEGRDEQLRNLEFLKMQCQEWQCWFFIIIIIIFVEVGSWFWGVGGGILVSRVVVYILDILFSFQRLMFVYQEFVFILIFFFMCWCVFCVVEFGSLGVGVFCFYRVLEVGELVSCGVGF